MTMESERLPRRLAAILYADVAGYSRATGVDEDGTHRTLTEHLDVVATVIKRHRGRVLHYAGDAALAMFDAAIDALSAATEIQREIASRNLALPATRAIEFRIGVNLGDVIEDRGDAYGSGVNVAARLASLAEPGGICVSESVRVAVGHRLPLVYRDIGPRTLKNIDEPVRAYRAIPGTSRKSLTFRDARVRRRILGTGLAAMLVLLAISLVAQRWGGVTSSIAEKSIAVLPFENLSEESDEYFSDGLTDELINRLVRVPGLTVSPRTSSSYFKGRKELPATIADLLGVRYLLEGSVRLSGGRLRVNVSLVDAERGNVLWQQPFDHENAEVFSIQDTIALAVVENLELTLLADARSSVMRHATDSAQAQELYFRAKYPGQGAELAQLNTAVEYYERATQIDSDYAAAYVGWADTLIRRAQFAQLPPQDPALDRARELLHRALEIEPNAAAHAILATLHHAAYDCLGASRELAEAERIDPDNVDVLIYLSRHQYVCDWEPQRALDYARRAAVLDPLNPWAALHVQLAYYHQFDYEASLREIDRLSGRFVGYWLADWSRWWVLDDLGHYEEALDVAQRVVELQPHFNQAQTCLAIAYARMGRIDDARRIYERLEAAAAEGQYWAPTFKALLLVALGDDEGALDALEYAYRIRDDILLAQLHMKSMLPLHGNGRFETLVDELGHRRQVDALVRAVGRM